MVVGKLRKSGNSFIVTVPRDEVERMGLSEGQMVAVEVRPVEVRPILAPDLQEVFEEVFRRHEPGLRYLADR
jgi:antitoxin component of MazEF toxin-antitoxin module